MLCDCDGLLMLRRMLAHYCGRAYSNSGEGSRVKRFPSLRGIKKHNVHLDTNMLCEVSYIASSWLCFVPSS